MSVKISPFVIDTLLLGPVTRRRQIQDFPVLVDVWARFAEQPCEAQDLLITPKWEGPAARIATLIAKAPKVRRPRKERRVSYLQDLVVAKLDVDELLRTVIPASDWWQRVRACWKKIEDEGGAERLIHSQFVACRCDEELGDKVSESQSPSDEIRTIERLPRNAQQAVKLGLLLGVLLAAQDADIEAESLQKLREVEEKLGREKIARAGAEALRTIEAIADELARPAEDSLLGLVWNVSLNRRASAAVSHSVGAVKADAARLLFSIKCSGVRWAVLDSGIDGEHPAFRDHDEIERRTAAGEPISSGKEPTRIRATYDFGQIRRIISLDNLDEAQEPSELARELAGTIAEIGAEPEAVEAEARRIQGLLHRTSNDMSEEKPTDWGALEELIVRRKPARPDHPHGTHVAGILGADWREGDVRRMTGMCADIVLYDFRVLGPSAEESEFAVIGALQFIRYLNRKSGYSMIDGVNMSLSIPHNVRNYACGRTPVCIESEALVANGVVVVAAAGNRGYQQYRLADNSLFESYAASSITDPGNADGVITVGATHRDWPHTYGVSFFSSRGPTGDGRMKPDILAPGERIRSAVPGEAEGAEDDMDGTSMAAPHVSGAAALLMGRHQELRGRPARIKEILCDTATDLGRERTFQGSGMVDTLRAIQSI